MCLRVKLEIGYNLGTYRYVSLVNGLKPFTLIRNEYSYIRVS